MKQLNAGSMAACLVLLAGPAAAGSYTYITLTPPGTIHDFHIGLNDHDQVAGAYTDSAQVLHGFVWSKGALTLTPYALDVIGNEGVAAGVNLRGGTGPLFFAALYDTVSGQSTVLPAPVFTEGYVPNGDPFYITPSGVVTGHARKGTRPVVGFLAHGAKVTYMEPAGSIDTEPTAIDTTGAVLGTFQMTNRIWSNFIYQHGQFSTFDLPDSYVVPRFIHGDTVGGDYRQGAGGHGFVRSGGIVTTYDYPQAGSTGVMDEAGSLVAGYFLDTSGVRHGFVQSGGRYSAIDLLGAASTDVRRVNAAGSLAGFYKDPQGIEHAFIATCAKAQRPCTQTNSR